jgi:probable selenium-dependent hydroxylase accessory protein YqeC
MSAGLIDILEARSGIVCAIGAGGKKTTLYAIARDHPGRVAVTATVYTPYFPADLEATEVIDREQCLLARLEPLHDERRVAYACPGGKPGRHASVNPELVRAIHDLQGFDLTLVKADGARMRWLKVPKPGEPVLPLGTDTVLVVVSARALGEPLGDRTAHRPERVAAVAGAEVGAPFSPTHLARLLAHEDGLLAGVGDTRAIPIINMVDDGVRLNLAREAAEVILDTSARFDRVVLARMNDPRDPLVAVVRR